jgi:hypothetical protein
VVNTCSVWIESSQEIPERDLLIALLVIVCHIVVCMCKDCSMRMGICMCVREILFLWKDESV